MLHLNILHRTDPGEKYQVFRQQQGLVHRLGIKATILVQYSELFDAQALADVRADAERYGDEIGLGLHRMAGPGIDALVHGNNSFWLFAQPRKRAILELVLAKYREVFGSNPRAMACYHFDASSMALIRELSPETLVVVGGCFEEGVRVFHGCNHSWYLFNEGMPWGPWYPSHTHALRPARDVADGTGILALPHLCRDMSLAYEDRDDFWASHPPNVMRGLGNLGSFCPYDKNLIDQYRMQERFNDGHVYYNSFVGAGWLTYNKNIEVPPVVAWELYEKFLEYLVELRAQGQMIDHTMSEYAEWHRLHRPLGQAAPEVYWAKEMLYGSGKHYLWYLDSAMRVLVDCDQGGSIGDLRPYLGELPLATGPDTPYREIGSYPYLIQSQHRTGYSTHHRDGSRSTLYVTHQGQTIDLAACQSRCLSLTRTAEGVRAVLAPARLCFANGLEAVLQTILTFAPGGRIGIERRLLSLSDPAASLELRECCKCCHGMTEYAEDLHDVRLTVPGAMPAELPFEYLGRLVRAAGGTTARADIPVLRTVVELRAAAAAPDCAEAEEGYLFNPYFTLSLRYRLDKPQQKVQSWLTLSKTR